MTPDENIRRTLSHVINTYPAARLALEAEHGKVWNTDELRNDFDVIAFAAPMVVVRRKADGVSGSLYFQHNPRFYFDFQEE